MPKKPQPAQLVLIEGNVAKKAAPRTPAPEPAAAPVAAVVSVAAPAAVAATATPKRRATAEAMASRQREISVSEFFMKNRHLLGFDNPSKALLTAVKEAVDNSLDACEEAGILPELVIEVREIAGQEDRFVIVVEDNGPGIVRKQVDKVFGKLLYGSKFHRLKQQRGQQGIGISAAGMYGLLTTGKPVVVTSRTGPDKPAHHLEITIDHKKNQPLVHRDEEIEDWHRPHGTRVEIELVGNYLRGQTSLLRYVEMTALANPHAQIAYLRPKAERVVFPRSTDQLPKEPLEIRPHPHGVELGALMAMMKESKQRNVRAFLHQEFSRVSNAAADSMLNAAGELSSNVPRRLGRADAEALHKAMTAAKLMAPPTTCLSPIGDELMRKGLISFLSVVQDEDDEAEAPLAQREMGAAAEAVEIMDRAEGEEVIKGKTFFISTVTRPPRVYRGNPFQIEVGIAYGGSFPNDKPAELYRFANRVPLLFQRGACAMTEAVVKTDWRNYQLQQPKGSLPVGPLAIMVHIASVWVPFTSESKEALAAYPEIIREIQLASQECGRKLATHIRRRKHADYELKRRSIFELYIKELGASLEKLTGTPRERVEKEFGKLAQKFTAKADQDLDGALEEAAEMQVKNPRRAARDEE